MISRFHLNSIYKKIANTFHKFVSVIHGPSPHVVQQNLLRVKRLVKNERVLQTSMLLNLGVPLFGNFAENPFEFSIVVIVLNHSLHSVFKQQLFSVQCSHFI